MRGGEIFADDEILQSKFRFLSQIFGGGILLPISKITLQMAASAQAAAGMLSQISSNAFPCALDGHLQPVLLDSASSLRCCTFSYNFCVAVAEQFCSNPQGIALFHARFWTTPQKRPKND